MTLAKNRLSTPAKIFVIAAFVLLYCPFFNMMLIGLGYIGDAMIQMRIGMDMIDQKRLILDDIYSWHQGLNWDAQEVGWYFLVGLTYRIAGIAGVIGLSAIFNYSMAAIVIKKNINTVNPYILIIVAAAGRYLSFPNYNARPHLVSLLVFMIFIYTMLDESVTAIKKSIFFICAVFIFGWFHGGMIPLLFLVFAVFIVIELLSREFKTAGTYLIGLVLGGVASVLNPIGINVWTYGMKQSSRDDYMAINQEWLPKNFSIAEITIILLFLIGFILDERLKKFDKRAVAKLCLYCMFIIAACKHGRFMNFTAMMIVMFGGEQIQVLLNWLNDHLFKIDKTKFELHNISYYILTVFCVAFMLFTSITSWIRYFPTNTVSDIAGLAAYDDAVIPILKEKNYDRIYNSFNSGTWLAFYGIPVHLDNRADLYLKEYSGEEYLAGQYMITSIYEMDDFVDKYDVDALVLDLVAGTTDEWFADDLYESDRYNVIYDNYVTSTYDPSYTYRWMIVECV